MMINRRQKFPEPPPPPSSTSNNNINNSDCVVVSVTTSSNNDPYSGRTVIVGNSSSSSHHHDFGENIHIDNKLSSASLTKSNQQQGSSFISNLFNSIHSNEDSDHHKSGNNNNGNFILPTVFRRLSVLVSLLLLQSLSQFVLEAFEDVVQANIVIPLFLTMLVGAGGNAGNQSAVRAIAMLAKGELNAASKLRQILPFIKRECVIGFICAFVLSLIGALRVFAHQFMRRNGQQQQNGNTNDDSSSLSSSPDSAGAAAVVAVSASIGATVLAISLSLFLIVALSCVIGVILPFVFLRFGMSPEHAAPAIQVIMDVLGVFLTCVVCSMMLPSSPHKT